MIELFGPTYRFAGEVLTQPEIIVINDHHYDEESQCYHIQKLLENSTCDPQQHIIVMDHVNHEDDLKKYHCLCLPIFIAAECEEFKQQNIQPDWNNKTHLFNFMINKPRPHREFLLMLIEHFNLTNYTHTLPWKSINTGKDNLKKVTNNSVYLDIINLVDINITTTDYKFGPEITMEQGIRNGNFKNAMTYQQLLQKNVFEPSCISLITEPAFYERETIHTEKTIMSIYAGTLPIWVGGWCLPNYMKSMGFDVFDDIIDHSYQDMADPLDRCYYAIKRNLALLTDFDRVQTFIKQNQSRFEHNLLLLKENVFLTDCFNKVESYPEPIRSKLFSIIPKYRHNMFSGYRTLEEYRLLGNIPQGAVY
jgi:hypothetical protein